MTDPRVPSDAAWSGALNKAGRPGVRHREAPLGEKLHPHSLQTSVYAAAGAVPPPPRAFSKHLFPRLTWGDTDSLLKHTAPLSVWGLLPNGGKWGPICGGSHSSG